MIAQTDFQCFSQFLSVQFSRFGTVSPTSSGEKLAKQVSEQLEETRRVKPQAGETWNDDLRLLREQLRQERERLLQRQKSVNRGIELD